MAAGPSASQLVSVIIPACNAAGTLGACLQALKQQALPPGVRLEVVVVDDHSRDSTAEVARAAGAICVPAGEPDHAAGGGLPGWLTRHPSGARASAGPAQARNRGVAASHGDPLLFTDADCEPTPQWAASLLRAFADPQVSGAKGTYLTRQRSLVARFIQLEYADKCRRLEQRAWIDFIDTYSAGYRRTVFVENGGFEAGLMGNEDHEFSYRLAQKGYRLKYVPPAAVYHQHLTSFRRYLKRKFTIGFWKVHLLRWHPDKALGDAHTPLSQRWQIVLIPPLTAALAAGLVWRPALWLAAALGAAFLASMLPLLAWVARSDPPVLLVAVPMMVGRAAAQAVGLGMGVLAALAQPPLRRSALPPVARGLKRALDLAVASAGLVAAAPLVGVLAGLARLSAPGPVLLRQPRVGEHGQLFDRFQLRLPAGPGRLSALAARWGLARLPELWNVVRGEMSLVGPQADTPEAATAYSDWHRQRLALKPGVLHPAGAAGGLPLDERVRAELDYLERYSLGRDLRVLASAGARLLAGGQRPPARRASPEAQRQR